MRMVVLLPAPLGPTKPKICPEANSNEMPSTARVLPKYFFRPATRTFIVRLPSGCPRRASGNSPSLHFAGLGHGLLTVPLCWVGARSPDRAPLLPEGLLPQKRPPV